MLKRNLINQADSNTLIVATQEAFTITGLPEVTLAKA
jgi:hypothetical protein